MFLWHNNWAAPWRGRACHSADGGFPASGFPTGCVAGARDGARVSAHAQTRQAKLAEYRIAASTASSRSDDRGTAHRHQEANTDLAGCAVQSECRDGQQLGCRRRARRRQKRADFLVHLLTRCTPISRPRIRGAG